MLEWAKNLRQKARLIRKGVKHMDESCDELAETIEVYATAKEPLSGGTLPAQEACIQPVDIGSFDQLINGKNGVPLFHEIYYTDIYVSNLLIYEQRRKQKTPDYYCLICQKSLFDYEPEFCCSGQDCGCLGKPTNPPVCSKRCLKACMDGIGKPMEQRRIDDGIDLQNNLK